MAVSLSLASVRGSLPVGYQLYLPKDWAADLVRRKKAGVPDDVRFATKPEIGNRYVRRLPRASPWASCWPTPGMATRPTFAMA